MPKYRVTLKSQTDEQKRFVTLTAASEDEARHRCEVLEHEYAAFRLDEPETIARYPSITPATLDEVLETTQHVQQDSDREGRFIRAGKVLGDNKLHRGWRALHEQEKPYKVVEVGDTSLVAVLGGLYGVPVKNQYDGTAVLDWDTDTIKVALTTNAYTVAIDTHDFFNDVTNEVTGTGYTAGGATLGTKTATYDTASDQTRLDAADTTWTTSTITARRSVVYKSTGTSSTSPLLSFLDFEADVSTTAGTFQITWDATGIVVFDVT